VFIHFRSCSSEWLLYSCSESSQSSVMVGRLCPRSVVHQQLGLLDYLPVNFAGSPPRSGDMLDLESDSGNHDLTRCCTCRCRILSDAPCFMLCLVVWLCWSLCISDCCPQSGVLSGWHVGSGACTDDHNVKTSRLLPSIFMNVSLFCSVLCYCFILCCHFMRCFHY
jgi:hypothetical protein